MAQVKLDVRFRRKTMGSFDHLMYLDINEDLIIDGEYINGSYSFDNDIQNLSLAKTPYYPKVLIITPRLKMRYTNWDTIEEAEEKLEEGDLVSHQIIISNETYYVVAQSSENISDLYIPVAKISQEPFDTPFLEEEVHPDFRPQKAFVTNATARSVAWIAYIYDQFKNGMLHRLSNDDIEEYEILFANESSEFARSYNAALSDFSVIKRVISDLTCEKRKEFFYESEANEVLNKLMRRIFHTNEGCQYMKGDFTRKNGQKLDNSGIFEAEDQERQYYLHVDYLFKLGFNGCKKCNVGSDRIEFAWGEKEEKLLETLYHQMLCPTSLIAQVFRCEEEVIKERLQEAHIIDGKPSKVKRNTANYTSIKVNINLDDEKPSVSSHRHYGEYAGSYAQGVEGYDDETIDDAFEGEPDNYWNID